MYTPPNDINHATPPHTVYRNETLMLLAAVLYIGISNILSMIPIRANEKKRKPSRISSMVGHHIEISNRFIHDYVAVFQIAKQCKTKSCHKPPLSKGGLEGLYI